jgi:hypothetical protein
MTAPVFNASVENGTLRFADGEKQRMAQYVRSLKGDVSVTVKKRTKPRSSHQNRYYWGVVVAMLSEYTGYEHEEMHDALKLLFLRKPAHAPGLPDTLRSTSDLSTKEFEDYLERVRRWADIELSIIIPLPNEIEHD